MLGKLPLKLDVILKTLLFFQCSSSAASGHSDCPTVISVDSNQSWSGIHSSTGTGISTERSSVFSWGYDVSLHRNVNPWLQPVMCHPTVYTIIWSTCYLCGCFAVYAGSDSAGYWSVFVLCFPVSDVASKHLWVSMICIVCYQLRFFFNSIKTIQPNHKHTHSNRLVIIIMYIKVPLKK